VLYNRASPDIESYVYSFLSNARRYPSRIVITNKGVCLLISQGLCDRHPRKVSFKHPDITKRDRERERKRESRHDERVHSKIHRVRSVESAGVKRIAIARAELRGFGMRYLTFRPRINVSIGRDHEELEYLEKGPRIPARSSAETNRAESRPGGIGPRARARARNIENGLQIRAAMAFRYSTRTGGTREGRGERGE